MYKKKDKNINELQEKSLKFLRESALSGYQIAKETGISEATIGNWRNGNTNPNFANSKLLIEYFETGKGLKNTQSKDFIAEDETPGVQIYDTENAPSGKKRIPFYDDVSSFGGVNEMTANMDGVSTPTDYIDTGDWFKDATAAIRHYGESMVEYPTGCILALKEVFDRELIIPGRDYMIETTEYRVTKRVQLGKDKEHITAYSTNHETYPDGRLIHEPFDIPWRSVRHISLVLGYVVKKNGGTMVYSNRNSKQLNIK
jgi:transcriptional regulator with XRE-family HTH domain